MHLRILSLVLLALTACSVAERDDFLIGRSCDVDLPNDCDEGQRCLPHFAEDELFDDYRCRSRSSFEKRDGIEAPLAYCQESSGLFCPNGMICNAERIREAEENMVYVRRKVCQEPDSPFGPPLGD